ncbi:MAG TPA: hypothetical protein VN838_29465 [Bradyrhizobium sp.]|nr:hypothetical protein [Bradyrhizobium sp.]
MKSIPFRKADLQSLIDVIELDDTRFRIRGSRDVLEGVVLAGGTGPLRVRGCTEWRSLGAYGLMPADKDTIEFPMQLQQFNVDQDFSPCHEIFKLCDAVLDVFVGRNWALSSTIGQRRA